MFSNIFFILLYRKSAPTWIPNSKGNRLLLGYQFPKEIGSNVDADIPDKFRIFETSLKKMFNVFFFNIIVGIP
ncbi:unnamed protein product [Rhizophagus irregularis]|nr:unnamed protein product [Rhizophagus irregularis]